LAVDDFRPVALACSFIKVCSRIDVVLAIGDRSLKAQFRQAASLGMGSKQVVVIGDECCG